MKISVNGKLQTKHLLENWKLIVDLLNNEKRKKMQRNKF